MTELNIEDLIYLKNQDLDKYLSEIHPMDVIDLFHNLNDLTMIKQIISNLSNEYIAKLLDFEDDQHKSILFNCINSKHHHDILNIMSSNELADFIQTLDQEDHDYIINLIDNKRDINQLLDYREDSAGSIMATEFVNIFDNKTVLHTYEFLQENIEDNDLPYYLYITDYQNHLKGYLELKTLVSSSFDTLIKDITNYNVQSININTDQEEVAHIFDKYDYLMIPVVDDDNVLVGVISMDDIIDVVKEETTEDIHRLAGLNADEKVDGSLISSVKSRLPWLLINLITACIAATVISTYSATIQTVVILAAINPIIAGISGNVGNQTMTLIVRSLVLKQINYQNTLKIFFKEISVGLSIGLIFALILSLGCYLLYGNVYLGIVSGLAILLNLTIATSIGFLVPITLNSLKVDPALASSVFVSATTDILGFLIFLSLATLLLPYLI